jgi:hypothetical protein
MKLLFLTVIFICLTGITLMAQTGKAFPELKKMNAAGGIVFGYDTKTSRIWNISCGKLPASSPWHCDEGDFDKAGTLLARYANSSIKDSIQIFFTEGPSADPAFIFGSKNGRTIGRISALALYITGDGWIYSEGHVNNMFNQRRKFRLQQDTVIEIHQPYYYVGLKTVTTDTVTLYTEKSGTGVTARLSKGAAVEVLLCDTENNQSEKYYLIKTAFGLTGWLRLENDGGLQTVIKGLYFAGD